MEVDVPNDLTAQSVMSEAESMLLMEFSNWFYKKINDQNENGFKTEDFSVHIHFFWEIKGTEERKEEVELDAAQICANFRMMYNEGNERT